MNRCTNHTIYGGGACDAVHLFSINQYEWMDNIIFGWIFNSEIINYIHIQCVHTIWEYNPIKVGTNNVLLVYIYTYTLGRYA